MDFFDWLFPEMFVPREDLRLNRQEYVQLYDESY